MSAALLRAAVVLHLVLAVSAVGAATHTAAFARRPAPERTARLSRLALLLSAAAMLVGALLYPRYKLEVRLAYLEANNPGAARLFDLKEQLVALALPIQCGVALLARRIPDATVRALALLAAALLWAAALLAAYVVTTHAWR